MKSPYTLEDIRSLNSAESRIAQALLLIANELHQTNYLLSQMNMMLQTKEF